MNKPYAAKSSPEVTIIQHGKKWWVIRHDGGQSEPIGPFDTREAAERSEEISIALLKPAAPKVVDSKEDWDGDKESYGDFIESQNKAEEQDGEQKPLDLGEVNELIELDKVTLAVRLYRAENKLLKAKSVDSLSPKPEMHVFYELNDGREPIAWECYKVQDVERIAWAERDSLSPSEPTRWNVVREPHMSRTMKESPTGLWVSYEDYKKLAKGSPSEEGTGWISVDRALPLAEVGEAGKEPFISADVLCHWENGDYDVANYDYEEKWWVLVNRSFEVADCDPIRWMPIPAPPVAPPEKEVKK